MSRNMSILANVLCFSCYHIGAISAIYDDYLYLKTETETVNVNYNTFSNVFCYSCTCYGGPEGQNTTTTTNILTKHIHMMFSEMLFC